MRYVQYLISQVRKQTENEDVTSFTGIQDSEFLQYINDAQHNLQALITQKHPNVFVKEKIYNVLANQDKYEIPSDCYLSNKILNVEFSTTGQDRDYYTISQDTIKNRNTGYSASPYKYIRLDGNIVLNPKPISSGYLRVTYIHVVDELDLRRGQIANTPTVSSQSSWNIVLTAPDISSLEEHEYICIVDRKGKSIARNLVVTNIVSDTITLEAYTPSSYDSTIEQGHYVVGGKNTNTHGSFDSSVERYLIAYCAWKILKRDSSMDSTEAAQELSRMASEIVDSYALISDDVEFIPQLNDFDDWSY